jgi:hypothetical protein
MNKALTTIPTKGDFGFARARNTGYMTLAGTEEVPRLISPESWDDHR